MSTSEQGGPGRVEDKDRQEPGPNQGKGASCTVNSTFNYSVGVVSVAAGAALIYAGWSWLSG